ncbi:hypothetical protein ACIPUO_16410 [Pectobacterium carotovorum]|uniref:hypothetical protein n=1 Tax=Pectobacterium carotovorum TaxID=554 RepID=UPI0037FC223C
MFDNDAERSREITEEAIRRNRFNDVMESIMYDINEQAKFALSSTRYRLRDEVSDEFLDEIIEALRSRDYLVEFVTPYLEISWQE